MRKILLSSVGLLVFLILGSYWLPLRGEWLDQFVTEVLSERLHTRIQVKGISFTHWKCVTFLGFDVYSKSQQKWLSSGRGALNWTGIPFLKDTVSNTTLNLNHVVFSAEFYKKIPVASISLSKLIEKPTVVTRLAVDISQFRRSRLVRIFQYDSDDIDLRGGWQFNGSRLVKAHLLVLMPNDLIEKLPRSVRRRMIKRKNGWSGARFIFQNNTITVSGFSGPLLKVQWKP